MVPFSYEKSTVLLLGETGCGKSTLINGLANVFAGSAMAGAGSIRIAIKTPFLEPSPEYAHIAGSEAGGSGVASQTKLCAIYKMRGSGGGGRGEFNIVDSPGLSDTGGVHQDQANMKQILSTVMQLPQPGLTALVLVLNGTVKRNTINITNVLSGLKGNMPDSIMQNVFVVCTNCGEHSCNTDQPSLLKELGLQDSANTRFFYVQNSAFSKDPATWSEASKRAIAGEWATCRGELARLVREIQAVRQRDVAADFRKIFEGRQKLMAVLHGGKLEAQKLCAILKALDRVDSLMKQHGSDAVRFANYMTTETVTVTELVDAPYHSTICRSCNVVCHNRCGLTEISTDGDNAFRGCYAFGGSETCMGSESRGKCRCSYVSHYHGRKTMATRWG